jgi:hypothetical protein
MSPADRSAVSNALPDFLVITPISDYHQKNETKSIDLAFESNDNAVLFVNNA